MMMEARGLKMSNIKDITGNYALFCSLFAWLTAQIIKCVIALITQKGFSVRNVLLASGGMPSSHSATVCALCTSIGRTEGLQSPLFAIAVVFAFLVMYDAMGVRWSAGEQAKVINNLIKTQPEHKPFDMNKILKEKLGHKPLEVVVGAALGIMIAIVTQSIVLQPV